MESISPGVCEGMQHMSESVFRGLCLIFGTSQQVAIRREILDISEVVNRAVNNTNPLVVSGSHREGFRLKGSDLDFMYWPNNHRVIMDMSQSEYYNTANTTLILSDSSESPPGFTLLQLLAQPRNRKFRTACVRMNNRLYISSSTHNHLTCSTVFPNSTVHGPCGSGISGGVEYDTACCFMCDYWPSSASSWIDRCLSWPETEVVNDIIRNGCHFVAIGHPSGHHENEEWRISFSQAEYKLVSSMNHCQFLTYGLLKLFLKEVLNQQSKETNNLLCSYHMKTTVFWVIQQNTLSHWCPQNLLVGFWTCFKLLLKWVYEGICPNFFIPQNNMFLAKVHGAAQNRLFLQLHELYKRGLACLLQSSSIRSYIIDVLYNPRLSICTAESVMKCEIDYDVELVNESSNLYIAPGNLYGVTKTIYMIEQLVHSHPTHYQVVFLQKLTSSTLQSTTFVLLNMYTNTDMNKKMYTVDKISYHMLKLAAKFGGISDMLYIAMHHYKLLRYREALSVLEMTKVKLAQSYMMYRGDRVKFTDVLGVQSWSTKMRQVVADDITLVSNIFYIRELIPEQQSALQNKANLIFIPVFVMLHFLEFLCYRNIDSALSQTALDELEVLVHHDQGRYVSAYLRDVSWEILGICQQMTGNLQAALYSYQQSLIQDSYNGIQTATHMRIQEAVLSMLH